MDHINDWAGGKLKSKATVALLVCLALALFFLIARHKAYLSEWLSFVPYLLVLACPLMHLFMHGGHDHGAADRPSERKSKPHDHGSH